MGTIAVNLPSDGSTIDAADVNSPFNTIVAEFNGNISNDNISASAAISGTKLLAASTPLSVLDSASRGGWIAGVLAAPNTVTNNGNRSYDLVFNSTDYTDELSAGMRLKTTRTVTAPIQCTDLEAGSSQYYSKTTPNKLTFTDDFTCMAWVKLESYAQMGIIARRNADTEGWCLGVDANGSPFIQGLRIAGNNVSAVAYQSIPLNKWVHVAASMDLSGTTSLVYIDGVLVPSLTTVTGTATALVQGTTALVVGALKSAGTNPFDGKIAQAAVFNAVLSAATIRSYMSQGLAGTETSLQSAYSFSNSIVDLNTTTPNDLTAQGSAVATATDTPFTQTQTGVTAGTTNYAEIVSVAFSTNTTVVVRVPDGDTIPTSGGVSAVSYSTQVNPYGWTFGNGIGSRTYLSQSSSTTTSTSYVNLVDTAARAVTVYVGPSGSAQVTAQVHMTNSGVNYCLVGLDISGATTVAASDTQGFGSNSGTVDLRLGWPFTLTGLLPGSTTFTLKYRVTAGTGTFSNSVLSVTPL